MEENESQWFVIHTYSGREEQVKKNLEQRIKLIDSEGDIAQVVVPTEEEVQVKGGQKRRVTKMILPGYILVQMKMNEQSFNIVLNTPGVTGFVSSGGKPIPLVEEEVRRIQKQMEAETPTVKVGFKPGQSVRVVDGPFIDFVGTVDEIGADKGRVKVLLSLFGRETPVELELLQVERL